MTSRVGTGIEDWATLRTVAIDLFQGELPHPVTEQTVIDAYELHPDAVARTIQVVATDLKAGNIRSGWGILRTRAEQILTPPSNPTRATGQHREKAITRAEQWIRNAGLHTPTWDEAHDDLFGDRGMLRDWRTDTKLVDRMHRAWLEQRPIGEQLDKDELARADHWKATRHLTMAIKNSAAESETDPSPLDTPDDQPTGMAAAEHNPDQDIDFSKGTQ